MQPLQPQGQTREGFINELFQIEKKDNFLLGKPAVNKLVQGVQKGLDIIKGSYGSAGSNVIIRRDIYPFHESTNDGKKILEGIRLADPYEMIGLNTMKEVADKCDKESGDGRKTAAILYAAILLEGQKSKDESMDIKRSLEDCIPLIKENILTQSKGITENEVGKIASIASENEKLGAIFQEIYQKIGPEGVIELDNSGLPETSYEITEGVKLLGCKYMYPYMCNADNGRTVEYKNPKILITKQKIALMSQLDPIIKTLLRSGINNMVVFCDEIELQVSQTLAYLAKQGVEASQYGLPHELGHVMFETLVIKAPTLWKDWLFEDFAKITGATVINPAEGTMLKTLKLEHLGTCDKIITNKEVTIVRGIKDISQHIKNLSEVNTDDSKIRIARLQTKTAVLKLGANSESELSHLRGKALDARNSSWLAMQGGVVKGGGATLFKVSETLPNTVGGNILKKALKYPLDIINENMGTKVKVLEFDNNVLDATSVVVNSVTNAISVAATQLTTKAIEI